MSIYRESSVCPPFSRLEELHSRIYAFHLFDLPYCILIGLSQSPHEKSIIVPEAFLSWGKGGAPCLTNLHSHVHAIILCPFLFLKKQHLPLHMICPNQQ